MDNRALVTIGLPFYNCERTLLKALRSIYAQTFQDWELILVDDGSHDASPDIAAAIDDPRVRVLSDGKNLGLVARLNQITQLARGKYVCRMDGDDLSHPDRLATQLAHLEVNPDVDVLGTMAIAIDAQDRPSRLRTSDPDALRERRTVLRRGGLLHPTVMARAEWMRRFPYDPAFPRAEDQELWVRSCGLSRLDQLPLPLYFYRETDCLNLDNYRKSCASVRKIFRHHGPALLSATAIATLVVRSHLKEACYRALDATGQASRLVKLRGTPLSEQQVAAAVKVIEAVLRTPVPTIGSKTKRHVAG